MLRKALITITALLLPSSNALSVGLDLKISNEMAEAIFLTQNATFGYGGADIGFGLLINENDDFMLTGAIMVSGSGTGDVRALHLGVGGKAYAGRLDFQSNNSVNSSQEKPSGGAIAIGGSVRYVFPAKMPFAILAEGYWAPSVLSFSDFDSLLEYRADFELEVTPSARAYVGYRKLQVDLDTGYQYDVDDTVHIGVRFEF
jgi:hypothetical protein